MDDAGNAIKTKEKKQESEWFKASGNTAFLSGQANSQEGVLTDEKCGGIDRYR
jgi:hypothetical protein